MKLNQKKKGKIVVIHTKGNQLFKDVIQKVRTKEGRAELHALIGKDGEPRDDVPTYKKNGTVKVFVRKRPMFDKDLKKADFDVCTVVGSEQVEV